MGQAGVADDADGLGHIGRELVSHAEGRDGNGSKGVHRAAFLFGCKCGFEVCGLSLWDYTADVLVSARGASVTSSVVRL